VSLIAVSNRVAMSRLVRNESAPFTNAERRVSSSVRLVRTKTLVSGHSLLIRRVASSPPTPGIITSMTTRSGSAWRTRMMAESPSIASPTRSTPGSWLRMKPIRVRASTSSSAMTTRTALAGSRGADGLAGLTRRAASPQDNCVCQRPEGDQPRSSTRSPDPRQHAHATIGRGLVLGDEPLVALALHLVARLKSVRRDAGAGARSLEQRAAGQREHGHDRRVQQPALCNARLAETPSCYCPRQSATGSCRSRRSNARGLGRGSLLDRGYIVGADSGPLQGREGEAGGGPWRCSALRLLTFASPFD
jgi:hypothetical protein